MTTKRFCLTFACVAVAAPATASATGPPEAASSPFATGLTNPRHIRFGPDGMLYVAEAGIGGGYGPRRLLSRSQRPWAGQPS
jgi:hypothetical protein